MSSSFSTHVDGSNQNRKGKDRRRKEPATDRIPSRVAQLYYKHGLFLSSYPTCAVSLTIVFAIFCSYPLLNIPLPGTIPTKVVLPYDGHSPVPDNDFRSNFSTLFPLPQAFNLYNLSLEQTTFPWARIDPYIYVQQILVRTSVIPWSDSLTLTDAFRGPLHEVFKLLEIIANHEDENQNTLSHLCLHVENVKRPTQRSVFPEYNCLALSPANFWQQNPHEFNKDTNLLNTIFHYHNFQKSKVSIAEMLFGMPLKDTGLKRYPMRVRQRTLQFALTLVLKEHNSDFLKSLKEKLTNLYPLHQEHEKEIHKKYVMYIYYPSEFNLFEFGPLCIAFGIVFIYVYLTIRKIEVIRSRIILALASCLTVIGSLIMSLGFCFFFGLTISTQSKGIYPYLVLLVGLENTLVLTKSVLSTDETLDVKIRLAQGLSKEGWSITKNLLTEITILTIGLATFVPVIQEFCIFAITGLISDFFLQLLFFSTILGLDIKRVEYSVEMKYFPKMISGSLYSPVSLPSKPGFSRSRSHPKLTTMDSMNGDNDKKKIPKRIRVANFWARTRFFQRGFMIWMVIWIGNIIYNSGLIEKLFIIDTAALKSTTQSINNYALNNHYDPNLEKYEFPRKFFERNSKENAPRMDDDSSSNITEQLNKLRHPEYDMNFRLSNFHWSSILKQYNISMSGRYVTVLPTIRISHAVSPEVSMHLQNPEEKPPQHFQWKALAVALDPLDFNDADSQDIPLYHVGSTPLYPKTPMEIVLTTILVIVSIIVLTYTLIVIYRCVCTRNYAEWRASWNETEPQEQPVDQILDAVPIQVDGHLTNVECIATDGTKIASTCLQGCIFIWDVDNGKIITRINRQAHYDTLRMDMTQNQNKPTDVRSLSGSPPSHFDFDQTVPSVQSLHQYQPIVSCVSDFENDEKQNLFYTAEMLYKQRRDSPPPVKISNRKKNKKGRIGFTYLYELNNGNPVFTFNNTNIFNHIGQRSQSLKSTEGIDALMLHTRQQNSLGNHTMSPIWCLDFQDNLVVVGCKNGRLEFWDGSGELKCMHESDDNGITFVRLVRDKVIATRLSGRVDFFRLETYTQGRQIDWKFTSTVRRSHARTSSTGSIGLHNTNSYLNGIKEELRCMLESQNPGHQQPVTCLDVADNFVLTGSQDHTLKVFRFETCSLLYTLHGHTGPITSLLIDPSQTGMAASGSLDGSLCVWDLLTGACMYKIEAHEDEIVSLASTSSYIISLGRDRKLHVWERFQGNLLNSMNVSNEFSSLLMLTHSLLVTARQGSLTVWDVRKGEPLREVKLDMSNNLLCPKRLLRTNDGSVVCDYGNQLRIVKFPLVAVNKCE